MAKHNLQKPRFERSKRRTRQNFLSEKISPRHGVLVISFITLSKCKLVKHCKLTCSHGNFLVLIFLIYLLFCMNSFFSLEHLNGDREGQALRDTPILEADMNGTICTAPNTIKNEGNFSRDRGEICTGDSPTLFPHCLEPSLAFQILCTMERDINIWIPQCVLRKAEKVF